MGFPQGGKVTMRSITKLTAAMVFCLASAIPATAQTYDVLTNFKADIGMPRAKLLASGGYLYGTTVAGGDYGYGSVFRIRPDGSGFETIHSFRHQDGANPIGELIEYNGSLYGVTQGGGGVSLNSGTLFRIDLANPAGVETLHVFDYAAPGNTGFPAGGLILSNSILYGMAQGGGAHDHGTVFAFDPSTTPGTLSILHSFDSPAGYGPVG